MTIGRFSGRRSRTGLACVAVLVFASRLSAADTYTLTEPADEPRVFAVESRLSVEGTLQTAAGDGQQATLPLKVTATHRYRERRLSGTGRNAEALRTLRAYDSAEAKIAVDKQTTFSRLRDSRRLIVARGRRDGIDVYSPSGRLTFGELELLDVPGDSTAVPALLPPKPLAPGESWTPESWVVQMLTGTEAVLESELKCTLEAVTAEEALVRFRGKVDGATDGAETKIELTGRYRYDRAGRYVSRWEITQTEKRSIGAVSPGTDVTATVVLTRTPVETIDTLTEQKAESIPLEPEPALLQLEFDAPFAVRFVYGREWHVFHRSKRLAILRLLEGGSLIAQCNVAAVTQAAAGKHTSGEQFQADVAKTLGERMKEIEQAGPLRTPDGRFLYRVIARGEANGLPMHWMYYLCAAPSGRQVSFVFSVESKLLERLDGRDIAIVRSLTFQQPPQR